MTCEKGNDEGNIPLYTFTVCAGAISIYNSIETISLIFLSFRKYRTLYFWSLLGCSIGIFLFAVGFLDLFMAWYDDFGTIYRPLVVLTIGWYGMVTGFAATMYSRLSVVSASKRVINFVRAFMIYNVFFSHFPTTTFTFGANVICTDFWVHGYAVIEKIQMTSFCVQEVLLSLFYLYYISRRMGSSKFSPLVKHTIHANILVLALDLGMLILEYIDLYKYQIMLKVVVYSVKLKLEFYILNILTKSVSTGSSTTNTAKVAPKAKTTENESMLH